MRVSHTGKQQCSSTVPHDKFLHQKEQEGSFQIYGAKTATCLMACFNHGGGGGGVLISLKQ
jgi:hypothetical protein